MRNLTSKWLLGLLTIDQNHQRGRESKSCLDLFNCSPSDFLRWLVTIDQRWIYHYISESKRQEIQWVGPGGTAPKRAKTQPSAGKLMASVSWDSSSILFIDYLRRGKRINSDYYCALLDRQKEEIARKRPHLMKKKCIFAWQCISSQINKNDWKINESRFGLLPHPSYFLDLAPKVFDLFPNLQRWLQAQRFLSNEEIKGKRRLR